MKAKFHSLFYALALVAGVHQAAAQGTAFTYQGHLLSGTNAADGLFDIRTGLYATNTGGSLISALYTNTAVPVSNGLFTITMDFGNLFTGTPYWLQIGVRTNGTGASFTPLSPRQQLTPVPYAIFASSASNLLGNGSISVGTVTLTGTLDLPATSATAGIIYSGGSTLLDSYGLYNFFAGLNAGNLTLTGTEDTGIGYAALQNDTTGGGNTANGAFALTANTSGFDNTASGANALVNNTTGFFNTAIGVATLQLNSGGNYNTAIGVFALYNNTNGVNNTASGYEALYNNTSGYANTANGVISLYANTSGYDNTAVGYGSLNANTTGFFNTAQGVGALSANTSGSYNTGNGAGALYSNTTGVNNTASGFDALLSNTNGNNNTASGTDALFNSTSGSENTAVGAGALFANITGGNNTAMGYQALLSNTNQGENTAIGSQALYSTTTGSQDTGLGYRAMLNNQSGSLDTAGGVAALENNISGSYNTAHGAFALNVNTNGGYNLANGCEALEFNQSGSGNAANGFQALWQNTTGSYNTADGYTALLANGSGSYNVALGYQAGYNILSGNYNIDIGNAGATSDTGIIRIGTPGQQTQTFLTGTVNCSVLAITGGSDLAEPFEVSSQSRDIPQGSVVVIDEENPGHLKVSNQPYDTRVAGVLSGANGIHPGIQMQQQGLLEGGKNVALSGRVYVLADASNGPIRPGDLLTTSAAPGRAMKVSDHLRAQGAILGKAMTGLKDDQGMVLVLVTLQ